MGRHTLATSASWIVLTGCPSDARPAKVKGSSTGAADGTSGAAGVTTGVDGGGVVQGDHQDARPDPEGEA